MVDLDREIATLKERCAAVGVPFYEAFDEPTLSAHSVVRAPTVTESDGSSYADLIPISSGAGLVIALKAFNRAHAFKETLFWKSLRHIEEFRKPFGDKPVDNARRLFYELPDGPLGLAIYTFIDGVCVIQKAVNGNALFFSEVEEQEENETRDDYLDSLSDDGWDDGELDIETGSEEIYELACDIAKAKGWGLCRNKKERLYFSEQYVDEQKIEISTWDLRDAAERASAIYEVEVLPGQVAALHSEGKTAKEVAETLGCSLAKAKRIIAQI